MRREKAAFTTLLVFRCCSLRFGDRALPLGGLESILARIVGGTRRAVLAHLASTVGVVMRGGLKNLLCMVARNGQ